MTDREMLELAAKAVGYIDDSTSDSDAYGLHLGVDGEFYVAHENGWSPWMPHEDRSDAFSLIVKMGMDVAFYRNYPDLLTVQAEVFCYPDDRGTSASEAGKESQAEALTMRAITRCAAEVGRAMR